MAQLEYSTLPFGASGPPGVAGPRYYLGTAAPTAGTYNVGDACFNCTPTASGTFVWCCTVAGSPGTWKAVAIGA